MKRSVWQTCGHAVLEAADLALAAWALRACKLERPGLDTETQRRTCASAMRSLALHQAPFSCQSLVLRPPACRRTCTTASLHAGKHSSNGATAKPSRALLAAEKFGWALVPPPVSILKGSSRSPASPILVDSLQPTPHCVDTAGKYSHTAAWQKPSLAAALCHLLTSSCESTCSHWWRL